MGNHKRAGKNKRIKAVGRIAGTGTAYGARVCGWAGEAIVSHSKKAIIYQSVIAANNYKIKIFVAHTIQTMLYL